MTDPAHRVNWDLTINIPTILTMALAVGSGVSAGVSAYNDLDRRLIDDTSTLVTLRRDVDRIDTTTRDLQRDQIQKLDALRAELRGELRDVGQKLDALLLRGAK